MRDLNRHQSMLKHVAGMFTLVLSVLSAAIASAGIEEYLTAFKDGRGEVRRAALERLHACSSEEAIYGHGLNCPEGGSAEKFNRLLMGVADLLSDPDARVRVLAVGYLTGTIDTRTIQRMGRLLSDPSDEVRDAAAQSFSLTKAGDPIVGELERLLTDQDKRVRMSAANALGFSGTQRSLVQLQEAVTRETDREVKSLFSKIVKALQQQFNMETPLKPGEGALFFR
jgi:HEAT repeats